MKTFQGDKFPYPMVNRPKIDSEDKVKLRIEKTFDDLDNYLDIVHSYIYTEINLLYDDGDERINISRIQHIVSSVLLRSIYLRNGIVDAINSRNIVCIFTNLKSFMEVPAVFAFLHSKIESRMTEENLLNTLNQVAMGNRGNPDWRIGKIKSINTLTMFKYLDRYIKKSDGKNANKELDFIMENFYGDICNVAHPNYDAHDVVGFFDHKKNQWKGFEPSIIKERMITEFDWYSPSLNMTIALISSLCDSIVNDSKINNFEKLSSPNYFYIE